MANLLAFPVLKHCLLLVGFGLLVQGAERLWPIRAFKHKAQVGLDWLAFAASIAYGQLYGLALGRYLARLPGASWLHAIHHRLAAWPALVCCLLYFLSYDFFAYWLHRLQHTSRVWPAHAFHHSPRVLNWLSGNRESPINHVLTAVATTLASLLVPVFGPFVWVVFLYGNAHNAFIHSNIRVKSRMFNAVFITGAHHFVHHASDLRVGNSNFAFVFTLWDRVFGTWTDPRTVPANFELGLDRPVSTGRLLLGLPASRAARRAGPAEAADAS